MKKTFEQVGLNNSTEVNIRQYTPEGTFAAFKIICQRLREGGKNTLLAIHP